MEETSRGTRIAWPNQLGFQRPDTEQPHLPDLSFKREQSVSKVGVS